MNRIMKCKAWDNESEIMYNSVYELYFDNGLLKEVILSKPYTNGVEDVKWKPARLIDILWSIGIYDSNEAEIYDGDIVEFTAFGRTIVGVVEWDFDEDLPGYCIVDSDGFGCIWGFSNDTMNIIGNKYENPELLKGEE